MTARRRADGGAATVWVVSVCALLLVVAGTVTVRGLAVLARHRAESAADLAALAAAGRIGAAGAPCAAAARIATNNHATLRSCRLHLDAGARSGTVVVSVTVSATLPSVGSREVAASARAGRLPAGA